MFAIDEVTMYEGDKHSDSCYAVAGDILDGYLYDLFMSMLGKYLLHVYLLYVVAVYHVTIVAIGHGLLKKFWPLVIGCVLRTAGTSII